MMARSFADRDQARIDMDKAVRLRKSIFAATGEIVDRGQLAYLLSQAGALLVQSGRLRQAVSYHQHACELAQPIFAGPAKGLNYLRAANACWNLATDYSGNEQAPYLGRLQEGLKGQLETLARFKRWREANPENAMGYPYVASMESMTAGVLWRMARYAEAKQYFQASLSILHGPHGMLSHDIAAGYLVMADVDLAMMLADTREDRAALPHAHEALTLARERLAAQGGNDPGWKSTLGFAEVAMGRVLAGTGNPREGLPLLETGLSTLRELYTADKSDAEAAGALARCDLWALDAERAFSKPDAERALSKPDAERALSEPDAERFLRAQLHLANQHAQEVIALSTAALQQDPDDASAAGNLRAVRSKQGGSPVPDGSTSR